MGIIISAQLAFCLIRLSTDEKYGWRYGIPVLLGLALFNINGSSGGWFVIIPNLLSVLLTDLRTRRIPNALIVGGGIIGVKEWMLWENYVSFISVIAILAIMLAVRWTGNKMKGHPGMGMGDVKMVIMIALFVGWNALWDLYMAAVLLALAALVCRIIMRHSAPVTVPFAPFMVVGVLIGEEVFMFTQIADYLERLPFIQLW